MEICAQLLKPFPGLQSWARNLFKRKQIIYSKKKKKSVALKELLLIRISYNLIFLGVTERGRMNF